MSSLNYLKSAIKQQGCALQQVAEACGVTKGHLGQLLNAKNKSPSARSSRSSAVSWDWSFPGGRKRSG
ncbi:MAG: Trifunctional NAD biosynthesis/regulator protein NadR [Sodalis sp.]|nr:MAG: Trifunctional NAD biosynthesis/regulator protein NadR [Sodalis sp.]